MILDPGKGLPEQTATAQRIIVWKRPTTKTQRDKLRVDRIKMWEVRYGNFNRTE